MHLMNRGYVKINFIYKPPMQHMHMCKAVTSQKATLSTNAIELYDRNEMPISFMCTCIKFVIHCASQLLKKNNNNKNLGNCCGEHVAFDILQ